MSIGISIFLFIIIVCSFILSSAFVSALETAYTSIGHLEWKVFLQEAINKPKISVRLANLMRKHYSVTIAMALLINNVLAIGAGLFTSIWLEQKFHSSPEVSSIISLVMITLLLVLFGDFLPKNFVRKINIQFVIKTAYFSFFLWILCFPITYWFGLLFKNKNHEVVSRELLDDLTDAAFDDGSIDQHEAELVSSALELDNKIVRDFMSKDPICCYQNDDLSKFLETYAVAEYTRIVIKDQQNAIYGVLNYKLLWSLMIDDKGKINHEKAIRIDDAIQEPLFIAAQTKLDEALRLMQNFHAHLAIVTPNKNSQKMIGVITIEDIIEELVGEIYDENDDDSEIKEISDSSWVIKPTANAQLVAKSLNVKCNFFIPKKMRAQDFFIQYFQNENLSVNSTYDHEELSIRIEKDLDENKITYFVTKKEIAQVVEDQMKLSWKSFFNKTKKISK